MNQLNNKKMLSQRFILSRRNQKGQVAVFVALIFQVIFVFFALLINVGLLVHHKINLQHSTDLAAYYGAMKQAEVLNGIAHVNYQIKQAWKLLTWRYRILGTFGFTKAGEGTSQDFPFDPSGNVLNYYGETRDSTKCNWPSGGKYGVQDLPFFCVGHSGFKGWSNQETTCQVNCNGFTQARIIDGIPDPGNTVVPQGGNIAPSIQASVNLINNNLEQLCNKLGTVGATLLSSYLASYLNEVAPRKRTIEMLARNLSLAPEDVVDLDGEKIIKGARNTFVNNLTEANRSSFKVQDFQTKTGLNHPDCRFETGLVNKKEFLKLIEFEYVNYFIHNCKWISTVSPPRGDYLPEPVYNPSSPTQLGLAFNAVPASIQQIILSVLVPGQRHTVGYEKNPHCVEYYAVKTSATPKIPFLPMSEIKLTATAAAKPFGGSIGPWYGNEWIKGDIASRYTDTLPSSKIDQVLPRRSAPGGVGLDNILTNIQFLPNYSLFVGDIDGLRSSKIIAAYHSALNKRDIQTSGIPGLTANENTSNQLSNSTGWPEYADWVHIGNNAMLDKRQFDSLAKVGTGARAIEVAVIAPSQFDVTHYSIDPDFFNNYYKRIYNAFDKIKSAAGTGPSDRNDVRSDLGAVNVDAGISSQPNPLDNVTFSVRDQILTKNIIFNTQPKVTAGGGNPGLFYSKIFDFQIMIPSSVLTSWTFKHFADYDVFPEGPVNVTDRTMSFGQCIDEWNNTANSIGSPTNPSGFRNPINIDSKLPPTSGNCITGGRTGYSVKIVSPIMIRDSNYLDNPLDSGFFNF